MESSPITSSNRHRLGLARKSPIFIPDSDSNLLLSHFYVPEHYVPYLEILLIPEGTILDRIEKLAYDISKVTISPNFHNYFEILHLASQDYSGETIHLLCVLKGGSTFFHNLTTALKRFSTFSNQVCTHSE